jgi:hypothetical protein
VSYSLKFRVAAGDINAPEHVYGDIPDGVYHLNGHVDDGSETISVSRYDRHENFMITTSATARTDRSVTLPPAD